MSDRRPPVAARRPVTVEIHGETLTDPYAWLRDPNYPEVGDPEIIAYLTEENAHTDAVLGPYAGFTERLFEEMKARVKEDDASVPYRRGRYAYYTRYVPGQQYPLLCRRPVLGDRTPAAGPSADEQVMLDLDAMGRDQPYFRLGGAQVSPSQRWLAYAVDSDGSERYTLRIRDLDSGADLPDEIRGVSGSLAWGEDDSTLFYVLLDPQLRPNRVYRHLRGGDIAADTLVYEEPDAGFFVGLDRSLDRRRVFIVSHEKITSEVRMIDAAWPLSEPVLIAPRREGHEYDVESSGDWLFIRTNDCGRNFRLVRAPADNPGEAAWEELIPHDDDRYLTDVMALAGRLAVIERIEGLPTIRLFDVAADATLGLCHTVALPDPTYGVGFGAHGEFESGTLRLEYGSLVRPRSTFDYHIAERRLELLKEQEIPSGYHRDFYASERVFATAPDGEEIPVSIVYRKDTPRDGSAPLYLYGYGSYGHGIDPYFSPSRLSLLDRGFVFALAHIRGGDEMGYRWYEEGKLHRKANTFTDFIAVAEHLARSGYTTPGRIAIVGGSAGGMLVGATLNMAPAGLIHAAIAQVPFVDVLNTMLDDTLPLTPLEYNEWGNPQNAEHFPVIRGYSPYDNVSARAYPNLFVTAGISDPRVTYWEPAKWVAKLRATRTDDNLLLLRTNMSAGHGGASGRWDSLKELAEEYTFLLLAFGMLSDEDRNADRAA